MKKLQIPQEQTLEYSNFQEFFNLSPNFYYGAFTAFKNTLKMYVNDKVIPVSMGNALCIYGSYAENEEELFCLGLKFASLVREASNNLIVLALSPLIDETDTIIEYRKFCTLLNVTNRDLKISIREQFGISKQWEDQLRIRLTSNLTSSSENPINTKNLICKIIDSVEYESNEELIYSGYFIAKTLFLTT